MTTGARLFGVLYPLLDAFPTVDAVAAIVPSWHRWHRRPDLILADLALLGEDAVSVCIRRVDLGRGFEADNVAVVTVPDELRPYHRIEHAAWRRTGASR